MKDHAKNRDVALFSVVAATVYHSEKYWCTPCGVRHRTPPPLATQAYDILHSGAVAATVQPHVFAQSLFQKATLRKLCDEVWRHITFCSHHFHSHGRYRCEVCHTPIGGIG
ncbi:hypothetical protein Y032_0267g767 [Ancylostoma ceylanicum]|nr:hypothetical protein Y032_0267g767 [Ancylostoma ceylanicum]